MQEAVCWLGKECLFSSQENVIQKLACRLITAVVTFTELRKKQVVANQKTGNVTKNALSRCLGCILHLNQLLRSGLKVSLPFHRKKQSS